MQAQFFASQPVTLDVPSEPVSIRHYLRQPHRLVHALADSSRIEQLDAETFRLKMRPLSFLMLTIQPTVDLRVWAESDGAVFLESKRCEVRGVDYINQRFQLTLQGRLTPVPKNCGMQLEGKADLTVRVELPPAFWFTPKSLIEKTGNGLLKSVLLTIKQRLMHQLIQDYHAWAQQSDQPKTSLQGLPHQPGNSAAGLDPVA